MHHLILSSVQITEQLLDLVSHASILEKIRVKTETEIVDKQDSDTEGETNLRILMHKAREHQESAL